MVPNLIIFWMIISGTLSSTWSSSINSIFTARSIKSAEIGIDKNLMESMAVGAQMALEHCQMKFKWDRWNCPESSFSRRGRLPPTREAAFVAAVTSAGVVHAVTRNCSRGELQGCGCAPARYDHENAGPGNETASGERRWTWGGCSDYLDYGEQIAKNMLDDLVRGRDLHALTTLHNNAAGRLAVRGSMQKRCRCHGVSGSCSMQTCWLQMAPFNEISNELRSKYEEAQKVEHGQKFNSIGDPNVITEKSAEDLIYLNDSPDYCKADTTFGWNGTKGRACSRNKGDTITPAERKSCKNLCRSCGHRVRRERRHVTRRCNCTFHWCCEVKCDTCTETVDEFFCE